MIIWATSLGVGRNRAGLPNRQKARAAKAEANEKFWAIGSARRVGRFLHLKKYGDALLAVFEMEGIPPEKLMHDWIADERERAT